MNVAIDEDAARKGGEGDEEARGVELVARLAAEDGGRADGAGGGAAVGVAVGSVEAAGEAAEDFEVRLLGGRLDDRLGLCGVQVLR